MKMLLSRFLVPTQTARNSSLKMSFYQRSRCGKTLAGAAGLAMGLCFFSSSTAVALSASSSPFTALPYVPPSWAQGILTQSPEHGRLPLGNFATPLYRLYPGQSPMSNEHMESAFPSLQQNLSTKLFVKRDDSSGGVELGGNKIRKLEFLLADALAHKCDCVITIGGEQSNHCRATAAAARMLGMEPHLILRTKKASFDQEENDLDLVGNVLMDRMVASQIYTCTPGEYGRVGSQELVTRLATYLKNSKGKNPYPIPVGGSNGLGGWGYIHGVEELIQQWNENMLSIEGELDHVVFACGSGGTAAGIALGLALAYMDGSLSKPPVVHAIGVCDDPDYFYNFVAEIADEMGLDLSQLPQKGNAPSSTEAFIRQHMVVHQGKGLGYAVSKEEELDFVKQFAMATGIVLDPVYSGKALYQFSQVVAENPKDFAGKNVLFWHTGGALGLYEKVDSLSLGSQSPCQRLDIYGKGSGVPIPP